ncbi:MAG: hypothetical protein ACYSU0_23390, partial [Planctomycetota bacterium]
YHYFRIRFDAPATDFARSSIYVRNSGRRATAVVYLNGHCVAWVDPGREEWTSVHLKASALRFLKKGRNVLAVRTKGTSKAFDIGLYAQREVR